MTEQELESFFWNLTMQMLGVDPNPPDNQGRVRMSWPQNGAPSWKIDEDVAFLQIKFDDDQITRQMDITYQPQQDDQANGIRQVESIRVHMVTWTLYGPNSTDDSIKVRNSLSLPQFRDQLSVNNIGLVFDVPMPIKAPELFNGQWWKRSTFYARFNEKVTETSTVPYITGTDIQVVKG